MKRDLDRAFVRGMLLTATLFAVAWACGWVPYTDVPAHGATKEDGMLGTIIRTVPHERQRYCTSGDWQDDHGVLTITVSQLGDWRKEQCVAYHELFEALMCKHLGITQAQVDAFDMAWQPHDGLDEPGDDPQAPYYAAHQQALVAERLLANALGLNWQEYEAALDAVGK